MPQLDECSNKNHTKLKRGRRKERKNYKTDKKKHSILLVCCVVKTGRNNQTKGKNNNFCIVYFEELVVANVLLVMVVTLETSHFERSPLNLVAPLNTDARSMGATGQCHDWMSVQTRSIPN